MKAIKIFLLLSGVLIFTSQSQGTIETCTSFTVQPSPTIYWTFISTKQDLQGPSRDAYTTGSLFCYEDGQPAVGITGDDLFNLCLASDVSMIYMEVETYRKEVVTDTFITDHDAHIYLKTGKTCPLRNQAAKKRVKDKK